jgi:plastocyanin
MFVIALPASAATTHNISISGFRFVPADKTIVVGDTVTWTNFDGNAHNVVSDPAPPAPTFPSSLDLALNDTYSNTFNTIGDYTYRCSLHSGMTGVVRVVDPPTPVVPETAYPVALTAAGLLAGWFFLRRRSRSTNRPFATMP